MMIVLLIAFTGIALLGFFQYRAINKIKSLQSRLDAADVVIAQYQLEKARTDRRITTLTNRLKVENADVRLDILKSRLKETETALRQEQFNVRRTRFAVELARKTIQRLQRTNYQTININ